MTFEELNNPVVSEETPAVEPETTAPSTSEDETTTETPEEAPADVSDQPEEDVEKTPRAQKRIQELTHKLKQAEEKASYWDELNAQAPEAVAEENEDGVVTVESIAKAVKNELKADQIESRKGEAAKARQLDAYETLQAHPVLQDDEELAEMVVAFAKEKKITFRAAADRIVSRTNNVAKKAEAKAVADRALKVGASSPAGGRVSSGQMSAPDVTTMSEDDKAANWNQILAGFGK